MNPVRYAVSGSTATLTLDSPENRNAITPALLDGIVDGLTAAATDEAVRSIVVTHTGGTFCAGADLKAASNREASGGNRVSAEERQRQSSSQASATFRALLECPKPIIAAINGHVRAGGMGLVAGCDFVVAGPKATFGLSEVRIGVVAAMIGPPVLARISDRVAADWMLRGRPVSAAEAAAAGFITLAVDGNEVTGEQAVEEILSDLRKAAPSALAASKELVNRAALDRARRDEAEMIALSARFFSSPEATAGMGAFLQKTAPPWVMDR